jgi:hypothetical protein
MGKVDFSLKQRVSVFFHLFGSSLLKQCRCFCWLMANKLYTRSIYMIDITGFKSGVYQKTSHTTDNFAGS